MRQCCNVRLLTSDPLARDEIVVLSHLRFAAGVYVLAAGLLMGAGGAVAVADPGSGGSAAHGDDGTNAPGQQTSTKKPKKLTEERAWRHGHPDRRKTRRAPSAGDYQSEGAEEPMRLAPATHGNGAEPHREPPVTDRVAPVTDGVAPVTDGVAPVTDGVAPVTDGVAPVTDGVAPVAPVSDVIALMQDMLKVAPLTQLQSDLYSFLLGIAGVAPVPNSVAAVSDVIALIQDMLTSVAGAVVPRSRN